MTRKKVRLVWIANDNARKASLKKRRQGIIKKVGELTILCDVDACLVIYSPDEAEPLVWPSTERARQLIDRFFSLPNIEKSKKAMTQESYLKERVRKVHDQLNKNQRKNKEVEMDHLMRQLQHGRALNALHLNEMYGLAWFCKQKMIKIRKRLEFFQHFPLPELPAKLPGEEAPGSNGLHNLFGQIENNNDNYMMDQWFFTDTNMDMNGDNNNNDINNNTGNNDDNSIRLGLGMGNPSFGGVHNDDLSLNMSSINMNLNPNDQNQRDIGLYLQYGNFFIGQNDGSDLMMLGMVNPHSNHIRNLNNLGLGLQSQGNFNTYENTANNNNAISRGDLVSCELGHQLYGGRGKMLGPHLGLLLHGTGGEVGPDLLGLKKGMTDHLGNACVVNGGPSHHRMSSFGLFGGIDSHIGSSSHDISKGWHQNNNFTP